MQLISIAIAIQWTYFVSIGGAQHVAYLDEKQIIAGNRLNWISQAFCILGLMTSKIAVACLIKRLQAPCRWRTIVLWVMMATMSVYDIVEIILIFTNCRPVQLLWEGPQSKTPGTCNNPEIFLNN